MPPELRSPQSQDEWSSCYEVVARSFNRDGSQADRQRYLEGLRPSRCLAVFVDGQVAAVGHVHPLGQFVGGRPVPMGGLSGVATAPEHRGQGHARLVTSALLGAMHEDGQAISTLYPASTALYRGLGFELAGAHTHRRVPSRSLHHLKRAPGVRSRRATPADLPAVRRCYRRYAATQQGWLDRPDWWWDRLLPEGALEDQQLYVVDGPGDEVQGYVRYLHLPDPDGGSIYTVDVRELCSDSTEVMLLLWRLVGSSSTVAEAVRSIAPVEPHLLLLLPDQDLTTHREIRWMTRVVDAPAAVAARGFPPAVSADVDVDLVDDQCPWNAGRWRLRVEGGAGTLTPGGAGDVAMSANALAALYTGYASATALRQTGLVTAGTQAALDQLGAAFAASVPWCVDHF